MKQNQRQPRDIIEARKFEHLYKSIYEAEICWRNNFIHNKTN